MKKLITIISIMCLGTALCMDVPDTANTENQTTTTLTKEQRGKTQYSNRIEDYRLKKDSTITYDDIHADMKIFSDIVKKAASVNVKDLRFAIIKTKCIEASIDFYAIYNAFYLNDSAACLRSAVISSDKKIIENLFWCFVLDAENSRWGGSCDWINADQIFGQMREDIRGGKDVSGLFEGFDRQDGCCLVQ